MGPELQEKRLGKLTASKAATIMGGLDTDGLKRYVRQLAGERVFGDLGDDSYKSAAMARGNEVESAALDWYEFRMDCVLDRGPHIDHPTVPYVAATPDAVDWRKRRAIEAKSPLFTTWAEWAEMSERLHLMPAEYRWQGRWQLWCLGFEEGHFVSWHPKPQGLIITFTVTQEEIDRMAERAALINNRIDALVQMLQETL